MEIKIIKNRIKKLEKILEKMPECGVKDKVENRYLILKKQLKLKKKIQEGIHGN